MVLTGLTMSPGMDAAWPWLLDLFGGRQSARSIHFIVAMLIAGLHPRPPGHGGAGRADQRDPLDDHRPLPAAEGDERDDRADHAAAADRLAWRRRRPLLLGGLRPAQRSPTPSQAARRRGAGLTMDAQRLVTGRDALAPRIRRGRHVADLPHQRHTRCRPRPIMQAHLAERVSPTGGWSSTGWSTRPLALSLDRIRRLPARTQITRHDCVEGWSAIGKWTGVPLSTLLRRRGPEAARRATSSSIAPTISGGTPYYESIDLVDAFHPQTILAWAMNDRRSPVGHGAPLGSGSSASSATSRPNMSMRDRGGRQPRPHRAAARAAIGRIVSATNGMPGSEPP